MAVVRVTLYQVFLGQQVRNVFHMEKPDAVQAELGTLVTELRDFWVGQTRGVQSTRLNYYRIQVARVDQNSGWVPVELTLNLNGSWSSDVRNFLPLSLVLQFKTATAGRRGRGRSYLAGVFPLDLDLNLWSTVRMTQFGQMTASLKGRWCAPNGTSPWNLCILPKQGPEQDFIHVTDILARSYPGTQVRRNFFRGD